MASTVRHSSRSRAALIATLFAGAVWAAAPEAPPSLEFLEFLADWQTEDGELVDPMELLEIERARTGAASKEGQ